MNDEQYFLDGKFMLKSVPHEIKMSHWIDAPVLIDTKSNNTVLDLTGGVWDLKSVFSSTDSITIILARYPNRENDLELILFPLKGVATINGKSISITDIREFLAKTV
ncbi:conserved hypothetical protein [Shewanella woodyi ATCC 51908]|uniref:Uncharacterized protein n=2 Tax=Shewanella woodyi TaxID=60961 RepID=B1KKL3_SHEWM|nr:conserved hypothetical protein [Shewanella woodyi ATCC 51908]